MLKRMGIIRKMWPELRKKVRIQKDLQRHHQGTTTKITQAMIKKQTWIVKGKLKGMRIPISIMYPEVVFMTPPRTISFGFVQKNKHKRMGTESQNANIIS